MTEPLNPSERDHIFGMLGDHLPGMSWVVDRNLRILAMEGRSNPQAHETESVLGASLEDMLGPVTDLEEFLDLHRRALNGERVTADIQIGCHDFIVTVEPFSHTGATVDGAIALAVEASEWTRSRVHTALAASEERYRSLVDRLPDAVLVHDGVTIMYANGPAARLFGASNPAAVTGKHFDEVFPAAAAKKHRDQAQLILDSDGSVKMRQMPMHLPDGSVRVFEIVSLLTTWDDRPAVQDILRDITERELYERQLAASEERYRQLFEDSPLAVSIQDYSETRKALLELQAEHPDLESHLRSHPDEVIDLMCTMIRLEVNPAFRHLYGLDNDSPPPSVGATLASGADPVPTLLALVRGDSAFEQESMAALPTGDMRHVSVRWRVLSSDDTDYARVLVISTDITERRDSEMALRESEERYRTLFDRAPVSLWEEDLSGCREAMRRLQSEGVSDFMAHFLEHPEALESVRTRARTLSVNQKTLEVYRASSEAEFCENIARLIPQGTTMDTGRAFSAFADGAAEFETEMSHIRMDGEPFDVLVRWQLAPGHEQDWGRALAFVLDITETKRAERELLDSERRFRSIVESVPWGMHLYRLSDDGSLIFEGHNPAADRILGVEHARFVNHTIEDAFPNLTETPVPDIYRTIAREGTSWGTEQIAYEDDVISGAYEVHAFQTAPGHMVASFFDITERARTQSEIARYRDHLEELVEMRTAELEEAMSELQEANRAKNAFLASMSHELRTPLNSIIGFSGILLQGLAGGLTPEQNKQIEMINRSGRQLLGLIGDVLDLAKIEAGRAELQVKEFDLPRAIEMVADSVRPLAAEKGLELTVNTSDAPASMQSDRGKVDQILLNLLSNAIKYTVEGSIQVKASDNGLGYVAISVTDTGLGVADEDQERIFEEFRQLPASGQAKSSGAGLGLAITNRLVEMLDGTISLRSAPGKGSTFTVTLPITFTPHPESPAS